jgi:hypothetical protein
LKFQLVKPKTIYSHFATVEHAGQKHRNGKMTTVVLRNVFSECIEGKLGMCLLLPDSIGDDWMVELMIIYIEKTLPKLWVLMILTKKLWGCELDESKSLNKLSNSNTY